MFVDGSANDGACGVVVGQGKDFESVTQVGVSLGVDGQADGLGALDLGEVVGCEQGLEVVRLGDGVGMVEVVAQGVAGGGCDGGVVCTGVRLELVKELRGDVGGDDVGFLGVAGDGSHGVLVLSWLKCCYERVESGEHNIVMLLWQ